MATWLRLLEQRRCKKNEARAIKKPEEVANDYIELRRREYEYLEVLTNYVSLLLEKEEFFRSAFKWQNKCPEFKKQNSVKAATHKTVSTNKLN